MENPKLKRKTSLLFSIPDKLGGLSEVLAIIKEANINLEHIESRPSKTDKWDYDFFVDIENKEDVDINALVEKLNSKGYGVHEAGSSGQTAAKSVTTVQWFPRKPADLDEFNHKVMEYGAELDSDHPGFTDEIYRKRRVQITEIAQSYKHGREIPRIEYTPEEIDTWRTVYNNLVQLYPLHACRQYNYVFPLLVQNCGYSPDNIPQLQDVSNFLQSCTGFKLRPVQGLLTARDFLNGLAFRVFHSTQYIRHHSAPLYTPEPDCCHELLGHVPLFADPDFADFSQEIGLASLGATDEDIEKLATCYWFTVEFGLCKEDGEVKAFGAGLLSSFGELKYSVGLDPERKPKYLDFEPEDAANRKYPITEYQPLYYCAESFQGAKQKLSRFAQTLDRPFSVRYNALTQTVEILDTKDKLSKFVMDLQNQMSTLNAALLKLPVDESRRMA